MAASTSAHSMAPAHHATSPQCKPQFFGAAPADAQNVVAELKGSNAVSFVRHALALQTEGVSTQYNGIVGCLKGEDMSEVLQALNVVSQCTANLDMKRHSELFQTVLRLDWEADSRMSQAVMAFTLSAASCNVEFLAPCVRMLVTKIIPPPVPPVAASEGGAVAGAQPDSPTRDVKVSTLGHQALKAVLKLFPLGTSVLGPILIDRFPHTLHSVEAHSTYLTNAFLMLEYAPSLQERFFESLVTQLLKLDVEIVPDDDDDDDDELCFSLELELQGERARQVELRGKLDVCMELCFQFISKKMTARNEEADEMFAILLTTFDKQVLNTHRCKYTQFLMFHALQFDQKHVENFLSRYLHNMMDGTLADHARVASACYVGSLLARALYIHDFSLQACLKMLAQWLCQYSSLQDESGGSVDPSRHGVFFAAAQVLFYVLCYRLQTVDLKDRAWLVDLRLDAIVLSRMQPLAHLSLPVVKTFARTAAVQRLLNPDAQGMLDRMQRLCAFENSANAGSRLELFFPFDPYNGKLSGRFIDSQYRCYSRDDHEVAKARNQGAGDDSDEEGDENDDGAESENSDDDGDSDSSDDKRQVGGKRACVFGSMDLSPNVLATRTPRKKAAGGDKITPIKQTGGSAGLPPRPSGGGGGSAGASPGSLRNGIPIGSLSPVVTFAVSAGVGDSPQLNGFAVGDTPEFKPMAFTPEEGRKVMPPMNLSSRAPL